MATNTEDGLTWIGLARQVASEHGYADLDDDALDWVLWNRTAFPCVDVARVRGQLVEFFTHDRTIRGKKAS